LDRSFAFLLVSSLQRFYVRFLSRILCKKANSNINKNIFKNKSYVCSTPTPRSFKKKNPTFQIARGLLQSERKDDGAEAAPEAVANGEGGKEPTNTGSFV